MTLAQQWKCRWLIWDLGFAAVLAAVDGFDPRVVLAGLCTPALPLPQAPFSSPLLPPLHKGRHCPEQALQELSPVKNKSTFEQPLQFGVSGFYRTLLEEFWGIFERRCADNSPLTLMTQSLWGESSTPRLSPGCLGLEKQENPSGRAL